MPHRRRRVGALCRQSVPDVFPLCRKTNAGGSSHLRLRVRARGVKEIVASVEGEGVYARLKYESGTHRVQRVRKPSSRADSHQRLHGGHHAEAEDIDIEIKSDDLKIDVYRSSGAGASMSIPPIRGPDHPYPPGRSCRLSGGTEPDKEPGKGNESAQVAHTRQHA